MTNTRKPTDDAPEGDTAKADTAKQDAPKVDLTWQAIHELATTGRLGPETSEAMNKALDLPDYGAKGAKASGPPEDAGS
jgi:hypothetical protein